MTPQRVTLITLGVSDLGRSRAFYEAMGWQAHPSSPENLVLFQMQGLVLGLFALKALAEDQNRHGEALGTGAATLAQNFASKGAVDEAFAAAIRAGAKPLKEPQEVFWGGYSGYYADPDGHVWELAMNPFWPLEEDGTLTLPAPADPDA